MKRVAEGFASTKTLPTSVFSLSDNVGIEGRGAGLLVAHPSGGH